MLSLTVLYKIFLLHFSMSLFLFFFFFFQAEDGIRDGTVTGVQTCALPICRCGFRTIRSVESIMPPSEIALRGSRLERTLKKAFHYPNYAATRLAGVFGRSEERRVGKECRSRWSP